MNKSNKEQNIKKTEENTKDSKEQVKKQADKNETREINVEDKLKETDAYQTAIGFACRFDTSVNSG